MSGMWRGRGLRGGAYTVWPIRKDLVVMSQWPISPGTGSVHRQLLPALLLWQPSQSMEEAGGMCPCFVWQLSQLSVAWGKRRQGQQQNMVDLSSSGLGNLKHTASPSYHAPLFEFSTGLCKLGTGTHQAEQASLHLTVVHRLSWIQGLTLNTQWHDLIIAAMQSRNEVTWSPVTCWSDITCSLAIRVHWPRKWMLDQIALSKLCFLEFTFLWIYA
jgi:hypothetical protein